jgi:hypothetical protein
MESMLGSAGGVGLAVGIVVAIYPLVALGRIWLYSKQQAELLI